MFIITVIVSLIIFLLVGQSIGYVDKSMYKKAFAMLVMASAGYVAYFGYIIKALCND